MFDTGGESGTHVNGQRISCTSLQHGDRVFAGLTEWAVFLDPAPPLVKPDDGRLSLDVTPIGRVVSLLAAERANLYAVLDLARDARLPAFLKRQNVECECLYDGAARRNLADTAPYLLWLDKTRANLDVVLRRLWGRGAALFMSSEDSFAEVRTHLRRYLLVETPEGNVMNFRFYDPLVWAALLPASSPSEIERLFGPVESFLLEGELANQLLRFRQTRGVLSSSILSLRTEDFQVFQALWHSVTAAAKLAMKS